ncbi:RES family NAD+ phosphorylase [Bacillus vallismortis]|uniref:RES family NAD+ phosphorylase n=1 Tax=Bacillus vallismortis TaxID=72361 RepID=UPI003DB1FEA4
MVNCCEKCFISKEIKSIVISYANIGNCDFCNSNHVHVYNLTKDDGLGELFNNILNIFKLGSDLISDGYPPYRLISIKDEFEKKWKIFNGLNGNQIYLFLETLLKEKYADKIPFINNQVGIVEWMNENYLNENSVLKGYSWKEFVDYIKHENRFHTNHINKEILKDYLKKITSTVEEDLFFRARVSNEQELRKEDMGAPPPKYATSGRANSEGISHLYLGSDTNTVVSEIRPSLSDTIYIGRFPIREKLKVIDFRLLKGLDVFEFNDPTRFAINLEIFNEMSKDISKPVRSGDSKLDYLPTQYIVDYIKSLNESESDEYNYDGIVFDSTLSNTGYNLMIFDPNTLNCTKVEQRTIQSLNYNHVPCS